MSDDKTLKVFISSPGDVGEERVILKQTLTRLAQEFSGIIAIEPFMWEQEALFATADFQSQIDSRLQPRDADVAIFILWSRLGTPLPRHITREDGSRFDSGTEYEFENAKNGYEENGHPKILVYRKQVAPVVELADTDAIVARIEQQKRLDVFFKRHFHDAEDDSLTGAFSGFTDMSEFEGLVASHLSRLIRQELSEDMLAQLGSKKHWQGSPYRGLEHFDREHAAIFFGRTRQITEVISLLKQRAHDGNPFVMLLGMSGVGKSSLVNAGIAPMLEEPDVVEGVEAWRHIRFTPADHPGDPFLGLVSAICREEALGSFSDASLLVQEMRLDPVAFAERILRHLETYGEVTACLLFIDQFEELFTQDLTEDDRRAFTEAIRALVQVTGIWTLCAMRSDSFPKVQFLPAMVALRANGGDKDLLPPSPSELQQIIRMPAQLAGLRFERDEEGVSLDQLLADQAVELPEGLPLLEFTLEQLYSYRTDDGVMTFEAYERLGGLSGSIAKKAEDVVASQPAAVRDELPNLLIKMVSVDPQSGNAHRKPVAVSTLGSDDNLQAIVTELTAARLIVSQLDADQQPIINLVHESLLRNWPRVQMFIANEREFLVARSQLEQAAAFWESEGEPENLLLRDASVLERALRIKTNYGVDLDAVTLRFIDHSDDAYRLMQEAERSAETLGRRRRTIFSAVAAAVTMFVVGIAWYSWDASQAVIAAELEEADRRLASKATSFARLSSAYRERGDWLNALLLSLDAARLVTNAENLSLVYDNLTSYDKLDVNRRTLMTSHGDVLFGESIDGGVIFRDAAGLQAYLQGLDDFTLKEGDQFWVSLASRYVVIHRVNGGFDLLQTSTGELVTDFSMVPGSVVDVRVNKTRDQVLLTRTSGEHALIQLATLQRVDIPSGIDVADWHSVGQGRSMLLLGESGRLVQFRRQDGSLQEFGNDVLSFELNPASTLLLANRATGQDVRRLPSGELVYTTTNSRETLHLADEKVVSLWDENRVALIDPEDSSNPRLLDAVINRAWPIATGRLLVNEMGGETYVLHPDGEKQPLPVRGLLQLQRDANLITLVDEEKVAWLFDADEYTLLHRIEPLDGTSPRLESGYLVYETEGTLTLIDAADPDRRLVRKELNAATGYLIREGYLFVADQEQTIEQVSLATFRTEKNFAHHNQLIGMSYDPARRIIFGIDEFGFQHAWESSQALMVEQVPADATLMEVPSDDYIGFFRGNQVEVRNRFNGSLVLYKETGDEITAAAMLPGGMGIVIASGGRVDRIDPRGRTISLYQHRGRVGYLKVIDDVLYSGGADGFARVFDLSAGRLRHEIPHWDEVSHVKPVRGNLVASTTVRGHLHLYDGANARLSGFYDFKTNIMDIGELDGDVVVALKEDNETEAVMRDDLTGEVITRLPADVASGEFALISLDQSRAFIATYAEPWIVVEGLSHMLKGYRARILVVDMELNSIMRSYDFVLPPSAERFVDASGNWLVDASFSPDASSVAFVSSSGEQFLWNLDDESEPMAIWRAGSADDSTWARIIQTDFTQSGDAIVSRLTTRDQVGFDVISGVRLSSLPEERLVVGQRLRPIDVEPAKRTRIIRLDGSGEQVELFAVGVDIPYLKLDEGDRVLYQYGERTVVMWDLGNNQQLMAMNSSAAIDRIYWPGEGRYLVTMAPESPGTVREIPSDSLIEYGERLALGGF